MLDKLQNTRYSYRSNNVNICYYTV